MAIGQLDTFSVFFGSARMSSLETMCHMQFTPVLKELAFDRLDL